MPYYEMRPFAGPLLINDTNAYMVVINGVVVACEAGSLNISSAIGRRSTAALTVRSLAPSYFLEDAQITIYDKNGIPVFSGYLVAPAYNPRFSRALYHKLTTCDKHRLADKRRVAASFVAVTGAYIAHWILDNILSQEGVTLGQIYDGAACGNSLFCSNTLLCGEVVGAVAALAFDYSTAAEALDSVVKTISSSGTPYYWQIDQNAQLFVLPYTAIVNSTIVDGTKIDEVGNPPLVTRTNPVYRNQQIIKGGTAETVTQNETRIGDGNTQAWPMRFAISRVPTVTVNTIAKTVGIRGVDTGKDFYWSQGQFDITQDSAGVKLLSTDTLAVAYIGMYASVAIVPNSAQIALEASIDGSSGIVEEVETIATTSLNAQLQIAGARLTRYAVQSPPMFEFSTLVPGYAPGQLVTIALPNFSLVTQMLIESVIADDTTDGYNIWYRVLCISGPNDASWVAFWGEITGSGNIASSGSVAATTIVTVSFAFNANIALSATYTPAVYACPIAGNATLCGNALFIC